MKRSAPIRIGFILALALCVTKMRGQSEADTPSEANSPPAEAQADSMGATQPEPAMSSADSQYVPALNGAGLISLEKIHGFRLLSGGAVSTGFDTNPNDSTNPQASGVSSFFPYLGVAVGNERTRFLLQYQPVFSQYTAYTGNSLQQVSASFSSRPGPRWTWSLGMNGLHGNDSVRPLTPNQTIVVGNVPGSGSSSVSYLQNAGMVTDINGGLGLLRQVSPRDSLGVQLANSYNSYPQLHQSSGLLGETINYSHEVRPTLGVMAYQQTSRYYLNFSCTTVGGGFGVTWEPRPHTEASLQGGPQLNSPGCKQQQGFSYHAYLSSYIRGQSQFYVRGDRQPVNGFLGPGLWQDDFSAGYLRTFLVRNSIGADVGYIQSSTLASTGNYKGLLTDASYARRMKGPFGLSCRYQNFMGRQGTVPVTRSILSFSITFTPASPLFSE